MILGESISDSHGRVDDFPVFRMRKLINPAGIINFPGVK